MPKIYAQHPTMNNQPFLELENDGLTTTTLSIVYRYRLVAMALRDSIGTLLMLGNLHLPVNIDNRVDTRPQHL